MALKHTAVFKLGPFPPEFSRDDIAKAFYDEFSSDYTVLSIQIVPGGVVKVYFNSAEAKKGICSWKAMIVSGVECQVLNFSERSTLVQVHHYPAEGNDDDLVNVSKEFGEVIGIRSQQLVGLENITTGTHLCEMKLSRDIPRNLRFDKMRLKVWYRGQPLECDICKGEHIWTLTVFLLRLLPLPLPLPLLLPQLLALLLPLFPLLHLLSLSLFFLW